MPVDPSKLDEHMRVIRDRRGPEAIHDGSDTPPVMRIPLNSPGLMRITGGGIPLGRMSRLWGGPSTGKSLIAWMVTAIGQQMRTERFPNGLEAVYYNIEKQYDPMFTAERGVDVNRLKIVESNVIEEVARECNLLLESAHLHIFDSCSQASSEDELAKDVADWDVALGPRVWKKALRYIHDAMDPQENAVIYVDHSSRNIHTQVETPLGGKNMEYNSSMSLQFRRGSWLFYDPTDGRLDTDDRIREKTGLSMSGQKEADGVEVIVRCVKSRVCRPLRTARMRLDLNTFEFDRTFELVEAAIFFDRDGNFAHQSKQPPIACPTSAKSSWYEVAMSDGSTQKAQGRKGLRLLIDADPGLAARIEQTMMMGR